MRYQHTICDYPWWYPERNNPNTKFGTGARKYRLEKTEAACEFPVQDIASIDSCMLWFWATGPRLEDAFKIINTWGFKYTTLAFVWIKVNKDKSIRKGPGHYTASNAELVLLAYRGHPQLPYHKLEPQVILAPIRGHSHKPLHVHRYIEYNWPSDTKIELFATQTRPGWTCLGDTIDGKDLRDSLREVANE